MKNRSSNPFVRAAAAVFASIVLTGPSAHAASAAWNVTTAGPWATAANWTPAAAPGSTTADSPDIATFSKTLTAAISVTVDANRYIGGITFNNTSAFGYTLATGPLRLNSGGVIQTSGTVGAHTETISSPIVISGASAATATFTSGATTVANGIISISGAVSGSATATNTTTLTLNGTGTAANTVSGVIGDGSGGGKLALIKAGAGYWIASGNNTYTGTTTVSAGLLSFGAGTITFGGGATSRDITVLANASVQRTSMTNAFLNKLVETSSEIGIFTGTSAASFDLSSSTGANLPNAFVGNFANNGAKAEYTGTLTPASDAYRLGFPGASGLLGMVNANALTGTRGLIVGGSRVELANTNNFTGDTVIRTGAKLVLGNNLAMQNSVLDVGSAGGTFALSAGTNGGKITNDSATPSPTFGGLKGSRNLASVFTTAAGNNETLLAAAAVTGFTLNPGLGSSPAYSGVIANFATGTTLTKTGLGTQTLSGANTYTGTTTVSAGTLQLDYTTQNNSKLSDTAALVFSGGTLDLKGGSHTEIVASTTLAAGMASSVTSSTPGAVLQMGTITSGTGATINFGSSGIATTDTLNTNGILGNWATVGSGNWAANSTNTAGGSVVAFTGYTDVDAQGPASTIADGPTSNVRIFADGTGGTIQLGAATTTINSLLQSNATTAATVNTASKTLALGSVWIPVGKAALTVGVSANDGFLTAATAAGELRLQNDSTAGLTINAAIADNLTSSLIKSGSGPLTLAGANTYAGGTTLAGGAVTLGHASALGAGPVTLSGSNLDSSVANLINTNNNLQNWNADFTFFGSQNLNLGTGAVTLNANRQITVAANTLTVGGPVGGAFGITKAGAGTLVFGGANTFTGAITVTAGQLNLNNWGTSNVGTVLVGTGGTLEFSGSANFNIATRMSVGATSATTGTVNQTGGTVSFTASDCLLIGTGAGTGSTGIYNLSGGTLTSYASGTRGVMLGVNDGTSGTFNLSGTGNLSLPSAILMIGRSDSAVVGCTALFNQTGGTATVNALTLGGTAAGTANATMTLTAGTFVANTFTKLATATNDVAAINIGGTADVTLPAFPTTRGTGTTTTLNFDGGTLKPKAASASYLSNLTSAVIKAGGARIDTTNGGITIAQALLTDGVSAGGLTKAGNNTLTLSGANTYTGGTTINGGTLLLSGAVNMPGAGTLQVNTGGTFSLADGTIQATTGSATGVGLNLATGSSMAFDWNGATLDSFSTGGTATATGNVFIIINNAGGTTGGTLITAAAGSSLNGASYYLANNTDFTASLTSTDTTVSIGTPTPVTPPTLFFWQGNKVFGTNTAGADNALAFSGAAASNWSTDGGSYIPTPLVPGPTADVIFSTAAAPVLQSTVLGADMTVNSVTFNDSVAVSIGGNTLKLMSTVTAPGTGTAGGGSAITVTAAANSTNTISSAIVLGASQTWNVADTKNLAVSGLISGTFGLTKADAGTLTLSGLNTYSGGTILSAGSLLVAGANALGTGSFTLNGGQLDSTVVNLVNANNNAQAWNSDFTFVGTQNLDLGTGAVTLGGDRAVTVSANTLTVGGAISGAFVLTKMGAGTLNLKNTVAGTVSVNAGVGPVALSPASTLTMTTAFTGTGILNINPGNNNVSLNGALSGFTGTINVAPPIASPGKLVTGSAGLLGTGTVVNIASGSTWYVNGGTQSGITVNVSGTGNGEGYGALRTDTGTIDGTSSIVLQANASIGGATSTNTGTINAVISENVGPFSLTKVQANSIVLGGANTYTGLTTVSAGALILQNPGALGTTVGGTTVTSGARVELDNITVAGESITINGNGTNFSGALQGRSGTSVWTGNVTIGVAADTRIGAAAGASLEVSGVIDDGVEDNRIMYRPADSTATVIVSGPNTYTGGTSLVGGPVVATSINRVFGGTPTSNFGAPVTAANGMLIIGTTAVTGTLRYIGAGETTDRTVQIGANATTPVVGDTGGATIENNGSAGALNFSAPIFNIPTNAVTGTSPTRTLTLQGSNTDANTISGTIQNNQIAGASTAAIALTKAGTGTWTLAGANTYTGITTVTAGTLQIDGSNAVTGSGTTSQLQIGAGSGLSGTVIIGSGAGTVTFGGNGYANAAQVGINGGAGALTIDGGTVNLAGTTGTTATSLNIGVQVQTTPAAPGTGTVTVNAGTLNVGQRILMAANNASSSGTLTIASGTVNVGYNGTLGYTGNNPGMIQFGFGTGTLNLNGGTLKLYGFKSSTGAANINFNGGTLVALGSPTHFMANNGAVDTAPTAAGTYTTQVKVGGAIIDTNSFNIAIPTNLAEDGTSTGGGLTKQGAGTLTLSGINTYTGATTVNAGTLRVNSPGSLDAASTVAVNGTGTLGGSGTVGGSVTVAATANLSPGASAGTLTIGGGLDISAQAGGAGTLAYELDTLAGTSDRIAVAGTLTIGSGMLGMNDFAFTNLGGLQVGTYKLITSGGIAGTLDSADLTGMIGGFKGTLQLAGNDVELVVSSAYLSWAALMGLDDSDAAHSSAKNADPDSDGVNNLAEFAFNGDPLSGSNNGLRALLLQDAVAPTGKELTYVVAVRDGITFTTSGQNQTNTTAVDGLFYTVQGSLDLVFPGSAVSHVGSASDTAPVATGLPDLTGTAWEYHTFRLDASEGLIGKGFLRAKVSETP